MTALTINRRHFILGTCAASLGARNWGLSTRADLAHLRRQFAGELLADGDAGYEQARRIWNAVVDRRPALIARCRNASDIARAVRFAAQHRLLLSVRGGGHNSAGFAVCDDGVVIDLSR